MTVQQFIIIAIMAGVTIVLRFIPFVVIGAKKTPALIQYLGRVLPSAIVVVLVVYVMLDIRQNWVSGLISISVCALIYLKRNSSMQALAGSTLLYMLLIRILKI